jgi:hypothetical protein
MKVFYIRLFQCCPEGFTKNWKAIGGCFDKEFAPWSNGLVKDIRLGHFQCLISEIISAEIVDAPTVVRDKYEEIRQFRNCNEIT